jgi:hypothetical protein
MIVIRGVPYRPHTDPCNHPGHLSPGPGRVIFRIGLLPERYQSDTICHGNPQKASPILVALRELLEGRRIQEAISRLISGHTRVHQLASP